MQHKLTEVVDAFGGRPPSGRKNEQVTVDGTRLRAPERYVTRQQLADIMGVSMKTIDRMVRDGMPSETWGLRSRRFLASHALAWARTRQRRAA